MAAAYSSISSGAALFFALTGAALTFFEKSTTLVL
jgi:hypothetical protein